MNWQRLPTITKYRCKFVLAHSKKSAAAIKFCKHERCCLKSIKEILQPFYSALRAPTAFIIGVCLSRMSKLFAEDGVLSFDFAINTLVNRINSFYFYAIKWIMQ